MGRETSAKFFHLNFFLSLYLPPSLSYPLPVYFKPNGGETTGGGKRRKSEKRVAASGKVGYNLSGKSHLAD